MRDVLAVLSVFLLWAGDGIGIAHERFSQPSPLKIVVIEGDNAVNIIQQKTAVAPVVEVRDRNDQPVAGAVVRFAVRSGRATFGSSRTLTITTNAAGRAAATTLSPTGAGAVQITATATYQGQSAVATIAQTNVLTAAPAAAATGAGGAGGGSTAGGAPGGAAGAGGGGGLSTTTLAIIGGVAAGGAVVLKEVVGSDFTRYSGPFSGPSVANFPVPNCSVTAMHVGTVSVDINVAGSGSVTGTGQVSQTRTVSQSSCNAFPVGSTQSDGCCSPDPVVNGTTANITFSGSHPGGAGTNWTYAFSGALSGGVITGTFTLTVTSPTDPTINASFPVTLR